MMAFVSSIIALWGDFMQFLQRVLWWSIVTIMSIVQAPAKKLEHCHDKIALTPHEEAQPRPTMVVFVHGTILPYLKLGVLKNLVRDFPSNISYQYTIGDVVRFHGLYQYQPIADYGLRFFSDTAGVTAVVHGRNQLYAALFGKVWEHAFGTTICAPYVFGWDGSLSAPRRSFAAQALYASLVRERTAVALAHNCPSTAVDVVLIAHSHGGSLGLLLAEEETKNHQGLAIEHLVLLGTPIQEETEHLIHHELFHNVWSLYSMGDVVQVLDMVTTKGSSKRTFSLPHQPPKLRQYALELLDEVTGTTYLPSHVQLWFYDVQNMQPFFLQARSPFNPLPISIFTPLILKLLLSSPATKGTLCISKKDYCAHLSLSASGYDKQAISVPYGLLQPYEKHFLIS